MGIEDKLKFDAKKPFVSESIHCDIDEFEKKLKRGDKVKISKKYNIDQASIYRFFTAPDSISYFMLGQIYIAVEDFLENRNEFN